MKALPLILLAAAGLLLASRQAGAAVNPSIPHVADPRDYFPLFDYSASPPLAPYPDPVEVGGAVDMFDAPAPQEPQTPVEYADPFEVWGANIFDNVSAASPFQPVQFTVTTMNPEANLKAFLKMIRVVEARDDYNALVYGGRFVSYATHPYYNKVEFPPNGWRNSSGSHAAGAYQIQPTTWNEVLKRVPLPDFSPNSQDVAAATILQFPWRQNAYDDVINGRFDIAVAKLAKEWEAFEKILAGNYPYSLPQIRQLYAQAGGTLTGTAV